VSTAFSEFVRNLTSSAIADVFIRQLQIHESLYFDGCCLSPWNAAKCEQVMRLCCEAQWQLGAPYIPGEAPFSDRMCNSARNTEIDRLCLG